jgi:hypothetical protein
MRNDPFALLGVDRSATNADLAKAFGQATRRGISMHEARVALNDLRDLETRAAMSLLAISLTPGYDRVTRVDESAAAVQASELVIGALAATLAALESHLDAEMPSESARRDVREYVIAPLEDLEP